MTRKCPKCGEPVPSNCITCPKCYAKVPSEPAPAENQTKESEPKQINNTVLFLLTIVPGIFGLLGLGLLYKNGTSGKGLLFLGVGLLLFAVGNSLILMGLPWLFFGIPPIILYLLLFMASILATLLNINLVFKRI